VTIEQVATYRSSIACMIRSAYWMLVSRLALVPLNITINLAHDSLSPLDAGINQLVGARGSLWRPEKVVRRLHVKARQNRCHDTDDTFAAFVHWKFNQFELR
jgi:hypothetical protein